MLSIFVTGLEGWRRRGIPRNNFYPKFSSRSPLDQVYRLDHLPLLDQPGFPGCPILPGSPRSPRFPLLELLYKQSAKRTPRRLVPTIAAISPHHILDLVKTTGLIEGVVNWGVGAAACPVAVISAACCRLLQYPNVSSWRTRYPHFPIGWL